jgi:NTP pyrophosphatase (non-canonical NTP hydrolase)
MKLDNPYRGYAREPQGRATMDRTTTIEHLKRKAVVFRNERDWEQFHDPKNLAIGLSVEAGELLELFLWKTETEVETFISSAKGKERLREELADVFIFILYLCEACGVDLSEAVKRKFSLNAKKYPTEKSMGSSKKYDEL